MRRFLGGLGAVSCLTLVAGSAAAQTEGTPLAPAPGAVESRTTVVVVEPAPVRPKPFAFSFGIEGGVTYFTENTPFGTDAGIGQALTTGYNLGLRASFEFLPWLALDARGLLANNNGNGIVKFGSTTTSGGLGALRFTLPVPHIQPYALVGFGGYHLGASGSKTLLVDDTVSAFEFGLGAKVPTGNNVEVGVEYLYSHLNSEVVSTNPNADGGDPTTLSLFLQYRLPI
jgi:opacity protein-like surface antigen